MSIWPSLTSRGSKRTLFVHPYPHGFFMGLGLGCDGMALNKSILIHTVGGQFPNDHFLEALTGILSGELKLDADWPSEAGHGKEQEEYPDHGARNRSQAARKASNC